jgi:hypothetical protein
MFLGLQDLDPDPLGRGAEVMLAKQDLNTKFSKKL